MASGLDGALRAWIEGLTEAALAGCERISPAPALEVRKADDGSWRAARRRGGTPEAVGDLLTGGEAPRFEPPSAASAVRGAAVVLAVPDAWLLARPLETVPRKSRPFLDAFVRHQIEKATPWRAQDSHYAVTVTPVPGDAERLNVSVAVVPRVLVDPVVEPLAEAGARRIVIASESGRAAIALAHVEAGRHAAFRTAIGAAVAVLVLGLVAGIGAVSWARGAQDDRLAELDEAVGARRQSLAAIVARRTAAEATGETAPGAGGPTVVESIEMLSAVLPDHAYLNELAFEGTMLRISGLSRDVAGLIPVIERSGHFADVSFYAPTVRMADGSGDRFFIQMRVVGAAAPEGER